MKLLNRLLILSAVYLTGTANLATATPAHLILNQTDNQIILSTDETEVRSIASLTKLMTALVIADSKVDMDQKIPYRGRIWGERKVKRSDLLKSLLIKSDNNAAESLATYWPGGRSSFIKEMNNVAQKKGMINTKFVDPSGINCNNRSTTHDLAILIHEAYNHKIISDISSSEYFIVKKKFKKKVKEVKFNNTNQILLREYNNIKVSKTGWTSAAGRCLALMVVDQGKLYSIVILGESDLKSRTNRAKELIDSYITKKYTSI